MRYHPAEKSVGFFFSAWGHTHTRGRWQESWLSMTNTLSVCLYDACWKREGTRSPKPSTAIEALQLFGESTFDLVLLDIMMPDRDGLSTLGELLSKSPQAKVIAMSGKASFLPEARDLGATETLWKPIDTDTLLDTIERVLEKSQS